MSLPAKHSLVASFSTESEPKPYHALQGPTWPAPTVVSDDIQCFPSIHPLLSFFTLAF